MKVRRARENECFYNLSLSLSCSFNSLQNLQKCRFLIKLIFFIIFMFSYVGIQVGVMSILI